MQSPREWSSRAVERCKRALAHPGAAAWIIVVSLILLAPGLLTGFLLDDYTHLAMLREDDLLPELRRAPWDLYAFMLDDPPWRAALVAKGTLPWFIDPELHATFWRPLSSLSLYLDHLLWPDSVVLRHLHSFAWYAALVLVVSLAHRRILHVPWVAGLATLMYAVDDAHGFPTTWIANRNVLISTTFGVLAVLMHIRWRQTGRDLDALAAPLLLALGLLGGESALCMAAYPVAYAMTLDRARPLHRLVSILPTAVVVIAWRFAYRHLGYGVGGSDLYIDPSVHPLQFLGDAAARLPALLLGQMTPIASEIHFLAPGGWKTVVSVTAFVVVAALGWWCRGLLRTSATARFSALGMVLSAVPAVATFPQDRLLFGAGFGAFAFAAEAASSLVGNPAPQSRSPATRVVPRFVVAFFLVSHVLLAALFLPLNAYKPQFFVNGYDLSATSLGRAGKLEGRTLVVINGPDFFFSCWPPLFRLQKGLPYPRAMRVLGTTLRSVEVTRVDERTLRLRPDGGYITSPLDPLLRRADRPFHPGLAFDYGDVLIVIDSVTRDGRPAVIRCTFRDGFDSPNHAWAAWWPDGYRRFDVPKVGESVVLPPFGARDIVRMGLTGR